MGFFDFFKPKEALNEVQNEELTGNQNPQELNESLNSGVVGSVGSFGFEGVAGTAGFVGDASGLTGNFIGDSFYDTGGIFGHSYGRSPGLAEVEKGYIMNQRTIALYPEVAIGIEEILRDLYIKDDAFEALIPTDEKEEFEKAREIFETFKKNPFTVLNQNQMPNNVIIFNFMKQAYIDGRIMVLSLLVDKEKLNSGAYLKPRLHNNVGTILNESNPDGSAVWLEPGSLNENDLVTLLEAENEKVTRKSKKLPKPEEPQSKDKVRVFIPIDPVRVTENDGRFYYGASRAQRMEIQRENLISSDFGLYDVVGAGHGFLLYAFKYANQLQALQDMLIPMRFRRSVARRVFNVDIASLPHARAKAYMEDLMRRFKYKKHYDATTGKIVSKTNEPTGIVEDYWFANRSGNKGTTVETIDEAGNFQDSLDDISYFNKKLYQSMFIPLRRIFESDATYDYTANSIEVDEIRFVNFLSRIRFVYNSVLTEMFQVLLKDAGIEAPEIEIVLKFDDWYSKAKIREDFENALNLYGEAKEYMGKLFSAETLISKVFGMTAENMAAEYEKIKEEIQEGNAFYPLYNANDNSDGY